MGSYRLNAYAQKLGSSLERGLKSCILSSRLIFVHRLIHRKWGSTIRMPQSTNNEARRASAIVFWWDQLSEVSAEEQCSGTGKKWEENAPIESDRYGGDLGRTLGFPVQAGPAHHPQRSVPF